MVGYLITMFDGVALPCEKCNLCHSIPRKPVNGGCGHLMCADCWDQYSQKQRKNDESNATIPCPACNYPCTQQLQLNAYIQRTIGALPVQCPNNSRGCKSKLDSIGVDEINLATHLQICEHELVPCPLSCEQVIDEFKEDMFADLFGAEQSTPITKLPKVMYMERRLIADHVRHECGERLITCQVCQMDIKAKDLALHQQNALGCIDSQVCSNGCQQIIRVDKQSVEKHDEACELKEINCDICQVVVKRNLMELHSKDFALQHVAILRALLKESEKRNNDILLQMDGCLRRRLDATETFQEEMRNQMSSMMKRLENQDNANSELIKILHPRSDSDLGKHSRSTSNSKSSKGCLPF